ncbi:MAG: hypothetical protein Q8K70_09360 [Bacteroidota bacterium]|nr:hypothetical protein [Bacteroidota bacterium]
MKIIQLFAFVILLVSSCKQEQKTSELILENIEITLDGPLFEGSNTAQCLVESPLDNFLVDNKFEKESLKEAILTELIIKTDDTSNFNLYQSITIQFVSENTEMVKVAVINPVPQNTNTITLKIAEEQKDIIELLKQEKIYIVADAILNSDSDMNVNLNCNLKFNIKH